MENWLPCTRMVECEPPRSVRLRGMQYITDLYWPDAFLNSSADYGVDFSSNMCCGETIIQCSFQINGGTFGWGGGPTYTSQKAIAWIIWNTSGKQSVEVTVETNLGRTLSCNVYIIVSDEEALIPPNNPTISPNTLTLPSGVVLTNEKNVNILSQ